MKEIEEATGAKLELTYASIGSTSNVISGKSSVTIGIDGTDEQISGAKKMLYEQLKAEEKRINRLIFASEWVPDWEIIPKKYRGHHLSKIGIELDDVSITMKDEKEFQKLVGAKDNALSVAFNYVTKIFQLGKRYKEEKYASPEYIERFANNTINIPEINGNSLGVKMTIEHRTTEIVSNEKVKKDMQIIFDGNPYEGVEMTNEIIGDTPPFSTPKDSQFIQRIVEIKKMLGYEKDTENRWAENGVINYTSNMPYGSDGNELEENFRNVEIALVGAGGLPQKPHAEGENIYYDQMVADKSFYAAVITVWTMGKYTAKAITAKMNDEKAMLVR